MNKLQTELDQLPSGILEKIIEYVNTGTTTEKHNDLKNFSLTSKFFWKTSKKQLESNREKVDSIIGLALKLFSIKLTCNNSKQKKILGDIISDLEGLNNAQGEEKKSRLRVFVFYFFTLPPGKLNAAAQEFIDNFKMMHFKDADKNQPQILRYVTEQSNKKLEDPWSKKCRCVQDFLGEFGSLLQPPPFWG